MSETTIRVEGLGKKFRIARPQEHHNTLRDALSHVARRTAQAIAGFGRRPRESTRGSDTFWALRNLSFEVAQGEVVGVIGANGAGKSTLLKVLSRITGPSEGEVQLRGRVGSLLEVGTGFHSELTGRENIFLSGAILGMRRHEIKRKFDEIVAFAEVGPFIDTPVKHYSSGMHLRLGFAVAAHLEPEILVVDEVLAVGDASFQKKCLGKMSDVAGEGRTVLFVSHNLDAVQRLCSRCLYLDKGSLAADGPPVGVITEYLARSCDRAVPGAWIDLRSAKRGGAGGARFLEVRYSSHEATAGNYPFPFCTLELEILIRSDMPRSVPSLAVTISTQSGLKVINADTVIQGEGVYLEEGENIVKVRLPDFSLNPGVYTVGLWLATSAAASAVLDWVENAFDLEVISDPSQNWGVTPGSHGLVATRFEVVHEARQSAYSVAADR